MEGADKLLIRRASQEDLHIRVLLPTGLARVQNDYAWNKALCIVSEAEWMDSEMKILVEA